MMILLYFGLNLVVLIAAARLSNGPRWPLLFALLWLGFGIGMANNLIEGIVFGVIGPAEALGAAGFGLASFTLLSLVAVTLAGKWNAPAAAPANLPITPGRLALVVIAYEALYFGAGILVFPYVADFYATRNLPPFYLVASLQVARSLLFLAFAIPLLRRAPRHAPLLFAVAFAVIASIAPLVMDNPYMPSDIRFYHAIETSTSNAVFGFILGWLFRPRASNGGGF
jgi:hypothetical protein